MKQQELFQKNVTEPAAPSKHKTVEDTIFERALLKAQGKLNAIDGAVRAVLREGYREFSVENKGRWGYLYRTVSARLRRAIRDSEKCRRTPLRSSGNRVRA